MTRLGSALATALVIVVGFITFLGLTAGNGWVFIPPLLMV